MSSPPYAGCVFPARRVVGEHHVAAHVRASKCRGFLAFVFRQRTLYDANLPTSSAQSPSQSRLRHPEASTSILASRRPYPHDVHLVHPCPCCFLATLPHEFHKYFQLSNSILIIQSSFPISPDLSFVLQSLPFLLTFFHRIIARLRISSWSTSRFYRISRLSSPDHTELLGCNPQFQLIVGLHN